MIDMRDTITNITKTVTRTSGDLFKSTKLNLSLSTEENELKAIYLEIGKKVHEIYQYGGSLGSYFDGKYLEIMDCERKIADTKEQLSVIKGVRQCPKCGKGAERMSEFCAKCGTKFHTHADSFVPGAETPYEAPPVAPAPSRPPESYTPPYDIPPPRPAEWSAPPPPPPEVPAPVQTPPPAPPVRATKKCRVCNSENEWGTKFCLSCGRILD